jgi:hypothetical protein
MGGVVHPDADDGARPGDRGADPHPVRAGQHRQLACGECLGDGCEPVPGEEGPVDVGGEAGQVVEDPVDHDDGSFPTRLPQASELHGVPSDGDTGHLISGRR